MKIKSVFVITALFVSLSGCGMVYTNIHIPRAYRSATPGDITGEKTEKVVTGEACNYSVLFLAAWGNAGYAVATQKALKDDPGSILYDVQSDTRVKSILGLYVRACTVVTGKVARLK